MANTFTNLLYHVVFSTKEREPLIRDKWKSELYPYLGGIVRNERGTLLEAGGTADHVHLLLKLPASMAIADMLRLIKANSSKWVNESAFCPAHSPGKRVMALSASVNRKPPRSVVIS